MRKFLALSLVLAVAATAAARTGNDRGPLLVGVVDLGTAFKDYQRKKELEAEINAQKERLEKESRRYAEVVESGRRALDLLKENSEAWRQKRFDLVVATKTFDAFREKAEAELKHKVEDLTLQLLNEIEDTVREHAKAKGYDLVLKTDSKGWGDERFQERIFRAQVSAVLYADPKHDITAEVVAKLNDPENLKRRRFH